MANKWNVAADAEADASLGAAVSKRAHRRLFPDVVALDPTWMLPASTANIVTANNIAGYACRIPKTGTLHDLTIYVQTSSGNVAVSVYTVGPGGATRTRLYTSGSVACPAQGWRTIGDPALAVTEGEVISLCLSCDNTTAAFGRYAASINGPATELPSAFAPEGVIRYNALKATAFPDAGTEWASPAVTTLNLIVIGRIS